MDGRVRTQQLFWDVSYVKLLNTHGEKHGCQQEPDREDQTFTVEFDLKQEIITVNYRNLNKTIVYSGGQVRGKSLVHKAAPW